MCVQRFLEGDNRKIYWYIQSKKVPTAYLTGHECSIIFIFTKEMGCGIEKIVDTTTVSAETLPWKLGMNMIKSVRNDTQTCRNWA